MDTKDIESIFSEYLDNKQTKYSLLLNGNWGSGKTYFWKNKLKKIAEDKKFKIIYISLNGISKIETLDQRLFVKLLPFINNQENTTLKAATTVVANLVNKVSKKYFESSVSDLLKDVSVDAFNFSNYLICFDDLERCQVSIKEVLGFINNLIEHKTLKTIILSDLANIDESQKSFDKIKEKVIGRELIFEPNLNEVISLLFENYKEDSINFYNFLIRNQTYITDILVESKQKNFRSILFYLDVLNTLFPNFANVQDNVVQEIILFSALICFEFKNGNLKSVDYKDFKQLNKIDTIHYLGVIQTLEGLDDDIQSRELTYTEKFYDDYLRDKFNNYFFYPTIYSYILSGYLNINELELEIKNRNPIVSEERISFQKLFDYKFRELTDTDFSTLTERVLNYAKLGLYSIYEYITIADFLHYFSNSKLIDLSIGEVDNIVLEGLKIAKERKELDNKKMENLTMFFKPDTENIKIWNEVKKIHFDIKKENDIIQSNQLIEFIKDEDEPELTAIFEKYKFSKELFLFIDIELLFKSIIGTKNKQLFNFSQLIENRYKSSNIGEFLSEDLLVLKSLKEKMEKYILEFNNELKLRKFLLNSLLDVLIKVCNHVESTSKFASL